MRLIPVLFLILGLAACGSHNQSRQADESNDHSVAHAVGKAAYKVTQESEKIARKAGQELKQAGKEAHSGWKDAKQEDKAKHDQR